MLPPGQAGGRRRLRPARGPGDEASLLAPVSAATTACCAWSSPLLGFHRVFVGLYSAMTLCRRAAAGPGPAQVVPRPRARRAGRGGATRLTAAARPTDGYAAIVPARPAGTPRLARPRGTNDDTTTEGDREQDGAHPRHPRRARGLRRLRDGGGEHRALPRRAGLARGRLLPGRPAADPITEDTWRGIERVTIPQHREGWLGTSAFDWASIRHAVAARRRLPHLRLQHRRLQRPPAAQAASPTSSTWTGWSGPGAGGAWPSRASCWPTSGSPACSATTSSPTTPRSSATCAASARRRRITMITYGAHARRRRAHRRRSSELGLEPGGYLTMICRPIPENSLPRDRRGASRPRRRGVTLVVLGTFTPESDDYHRQVRRRGRATRSSSPGPIYDPATVQALRFHALGLPPRPHRRRHQPLARRGDGGRQPGHRPRQRLQPLGRRAGAALLPRRRRPGRPARRAARPTRTSSTRCTTRPGPAMPQSSRGSTSAGQYEAVIARFHAARRSRGPRGAARRDRR